MDKAKHKSLKRDYKEMPRLTGVYLIKNEKTGKVFIGSSLNVTARINRHKAEFAFGSEKIPGLLDDWNKYGEENFTFDVLEVLEGEYDSDAALKEDLVLLEQIWIEKYNPFGDNGYNALE